MKKLIAAVLLLTLMLTMAGCESGDPKHDPWAWAQELDEDDISFASNGQELTRDEISELVDLINDLKKSDFTEDVNKTGTTPEYFVTIFTKDGSKYSFGQIDSKFGDLSFTFDEKHWFINNEALDNFIKEQ